MLGYCRMARPKIGTVVVHSLSRFSRNVGVHHEIRNTMLAFGTTLRSATEALDNSPSGKLIESLIASVAQFENDVKAQRTVEGMKEANRRGRWTWTAPLGYLNGRNRSDRSLIPDADRCELIRKAFELVAVGDRSTNDVLRTVTALGLRSRKGATLTAQTFGALLKNPAYAGRLRATAWGQEHRGDWEPLVDESLFRQVQSRVSHPKKSRRRPAHPDFPLRRFVSCGRCERPLTGSHSRGRTGRYPYYHCAKCNRVRTPKSQLEASFTELLERLQLRPEFLRLFRAIVVDCWQAERATARNLRSDVEGRIARLKLDMDRVVQAFVIDGKIDADAYNLGIGRLRDELAAAECELSDATLDEMEIEGVMTFAEYVLGNLASLWAGASAEDRVLLQYSMFPTGLVWDGGSFGTAATNSAFSWLRVIVEGKSSVASPTGFEPVF